MPLAIRVEGPYGHLGINLAKYSCILAVCGGIGFTPTGPLLQMVLDADRRRACLPLLRCMRVVWVVRSADCLLWFQELLRGARAMSPSPGEWERSCMLKLNAVALPCCCSRVKNNGVKRGGVEDLGNLRMMHGERGLCKDGAQQQTASSYLV